MEGNLNERIWMASKSGDGRFARCGFLGFCAVRLSPEPAQFTFQFLQLLSLLIQPVPKVEVRLSQFANLHSEILLLLGRFCLHHR